MDQDLLEWRRKLIAAPPSTREAMLAAALKQVAWNTLDPDLLRLAHLFEALVKGWVAFALAPNLPKKPGMESAYAISTLLTGGWSKAPDATWRSDKALRQWGFEHDPVEAGKTWRKRLLKKVRLRKESEQSDDRDELILLTFRAIDDRKLRVRDPLKST